MVKGERARVLWYSEVAEEVAAGNDLLAVLEDTIVAGVDTKLQRRLEIVGAMLACGWVGLG